MSGNYTTPLGLGTIPFQPRDLGEKKAREKAHNRYYVDYSIGSVGLVVVQNAVVEAAWSSSSPSFYRCWCCLVYVEVCVVSTCVTASTSSQVSNLHFFSSTNIPNACKLLRATVLLTRDVQAGAAGRYWCELCERTW